MTTVTVRNPCGLPRMFGAFWSRADTQLQVWWQEPGEIRSFQTTWISAGVWVWDGNKYVYVPEEWVTVV